MATCYSFAIVISVLVTNDTGAVPCETNDTGAMPCETNDIKSGAVCHKTHRSGVVSFATMKTKLRNLAKKDGPRNTLALGPLVHVFLMHTRRVQDADVAALEPA